MRVRSASSRRAVTREYYKACGYAVRVATLFAAAVLTTHRAHAHEPFEITAQARVYTDRVMLHASMSSTTAGVLCWGQGERVRDLEQSDLDALPVKFQACAAGLFKVESNGVVLEPAQVRVYLSQEHDFEVSLGYPAARPGPLRFEAVFLRRLTDRSYGATLTAVAEKVFLGQALLRADEPLLAVDLPEPAATPATPPRVASPWAFLRLGVFHILTGYDHLAFLLGVLLGCRTARDALGMVTGFTLGHSLTLSLAALNVVALPSGLVEPLIAASVAFVGIETVLRREHTFARLLLTLLFGAVHGFGFAGALREVGLGANGAPLALPLLFFNLGVELGQALVGAPAFAALLLLSRRPDLARPTRTALGLLVGTVGLYWFVQRLPLHH